MFKRYNKSYGALQPEIKLTNGLYQRINSTFTTR